MLVHRVPHPPNRGDRIRSFHLLEFLAQRANVYLAALAEEPLEPGSLAALQGLCSRVAIEPLGKSRWCRAAASLASGRSATAGLFRSPRLAATISEWAAEVDFQSVVVFCSSMGQYLDLLGLQKPARPWSIWLMSIAKNSSIMPPLPAAPSVFSIASKAAAYNSSKPRSSSEPKPSHWSARLKPTCCESSAPAPTSSAFPNGVDLDYFSPSEQQGRQDRGVFVGALDYRPNIDGIVWFCQNVWPRLREQRPTATLAIVGRQPDAAVQRLASLPGVEVIGQVPDVRPHLADAQVAIVPLQIARGIQNKVLEAMAAGRPVVASREALEGLTVEPGIHVARAESPQEWLDELKPSFRRPRRPPRPIHRRPRPRHPPPHLVRLPRALHRATGAAGCSFLNHRLIDLSCFFKTARHSPS